MSNCIFCVKRAGCARQKLVRSPAKGLFVISGSVWKVQGDDFVSKWASCREANQCSSQHPPPSRFSCLFSPSFCLFCSCRQKQMRIYGSQWVRGADFSVPCRSRGTRASPFLQGVGGRSGAEPKQRISSLHRTHGGQPTCGSPVSCTCHEILVHSFTTRVIRPTKFPTQGCLWLYKKS